MDRFCTQMNKNGIIIYYQTGTSQVKKCMECSQKNGKGKTRTKFGKSTNLPLKLTRINLSSKINLNSNEW